MATESTVPPWLNAMRTLTGTKESPGTPDNPVIMGMADTIGAAYPEMTSYCNQYTGDEIPWCGLAAAYCMTMAGIRPPFGSTDTKRFLWAQAWANDPNYQRIDKPVPGCIVVLTRSGGGHVTLYESTSGSSYKCRGGNQSDAVNLSSYPISNVIALMWPKDSGTPLPPAPPPQRRVIKQGDSGPDVAALQHTLGIPADGDFGPVTDAQVEAFQAACKLTVDGVVGSNTWAASSELAQRKATGSDGLSDELTAQIVALAKASDIAEYSWRDRGLPPPGYIPGMALSFALAAQWLAEDEEAANVMAAAQVGDTDNDALAWYKSEFEALGMSNNSDGIATLRHLFVLMIGLGMRESSGVYSEGRDMSASNVTADTAEAGLFQTSANISTAHRQIPLLLDHYFDDPNGFLPTFQEAISPKADDLKHYGSGDGARFQFITKYAPAFAAMSTAIGLRTRRKHWGPINNKAAQLRPEADAMLRAVQDLVLAQPPEPIPPEPEPEAVTVAISIAATGPVSITVNGVPISVGDS